GIRRVPVIVLVGSLDGLADGPHRHRAGHAHETARAAEGEAAQVLDADGVDLHVLAGRDGAVDLGGGVVLELAEVHAAGDADKAARHGAGEGEGPGLVRRGDVNALVGVGVAVPVGLIDLGVVADVSPGGGVDDRDGDAAGDADKAAGPGDRQV